jgi:hypothetical protein
LLKEDELSPLPSGSDESHYMFPKDSGVRSENISRISENNDSNSVSEQDHFSVYVTDVFNSFVVKAIIS